MQLAIRRSRVPIDVETALENRIERLELAQQVELLRLNLCLLNLHVAVVFQRQQDRIAQAQADLAILHVILEVLRRRQLVCAYARRHHAAITLGRLCLCGQKCNQSEN